MVKLRKEQLSGMNCHYARHTLTYFLNSLVDNGLKNIELWGASPYLHIEDATSELLGKVRREIESRGLNLICFTPETVVYPVNIAATEDYIRERSLRSMLRSIECTSELGANMMLLTPGWGYITESREEALKYSMDSIAKLTKRAEELGITLALEHLSPISSNLINTAAQIKSVIEKVNSKNLKGMLDTCQVGLVGEHVRDYFEILGEDLVHIHIVDGTPGGHLAFGDGNLPLQDFVKTIGEYNYKGYLSMEIADRRYFAHPEVADKRSIELFYEWVSN